MFVCFVLPAQIVLSSSSSPQMPKLLPGEDDGLGSHLGRCGLITPLDIQLDTERGNETEEKDSFNEAEGREVPPKK